MAFVGRQKRQGVVTPLEIRNAVVQGTGLQRGARLDSASIVALALVYVGDRVDGLGAALIHEREGEMATANAISGVAEALGDIQVAMVRISNIEAAIQKLAGKVGDTPARTRAAAKERSPASRTPGGGSRGAQAR